MIKTETAHNVQSLMPLYEQNYRLAIGVIPALRSITRPVTLILHGDPRSCVSVIECTRYTSTLLVSHSFGSHASELLRNITMQLRVYHDARLLEVLSYQNRRRFAPHYQFPNDRMLSRCEKRQVNLFLGEWLCWCLEGGRCFEYDPGGLHYAFC
jgi:uncharacterized protein YqiB (DUF1249 family)